MENESKFINYLKTNAYDNLDISSHTLDLQGWVNGGFDECLQLVISFLKDKENIVFFEVGSWKGASVSKICENFNQIDLKYIICIDTWLGAPEFLTWGLDDNTRGISLNIENGYPKVFYTFTKNIKTLNLHNTIIPFPISSIQAADVLEYYKIYADAMYIDGAHEYKAVIADLETYKTILKPGGILWGDDYNWPGVYQAVNEFSTKYNYKVTVIDVNWLIYTDQFKDVETIHENVETIHENVETIHENVEINWKVYISNYPDLQATGIDTEEKAITHFNNHGKSEGRTDKPLK